MAGCPIAVYTDGGLIHANPSPIGGTWAACHVDADDQLVWSASGLILAEAGDPDLALVTNNQAEFRAMLAGLDALPDGWSGTVYADSAVTLARFSRPETAGLKGIPLDWRRRMALVLSRLGRLGFVLLDGHPSRAQLAAGVGKRGNPVSRWNVYVDRLCTETARGYLGTAPTRTRTRVTT